MSSKAAHGTAKGRVKGTSASAAKGGRPRSLSVGGDTFPAAVCEGHPVLMDARAPPAPAALPRPHRIPAWLG